MPVSYAGVPLITVTAQAAAWVDAALDTETINLFQFRHDKSQTQQRLSIPNKETRYKPRLGSLMWPSGSRRWATALFAVTTNQLAAIKTAVGYPASYGAASLVISDGTGKSGRGITASNMWILPSYPAIQVPGTNGLYLLTLVDQRYWWWYTIASLAVTYGGSPTTYTALIHQALSSVAVDSTNSKYRTPGMAHNGVDEYIALLLDSIAYNCGERIRVDLAGNVYSYTAATALARTNTNLALSNLVLARGGYVDATELSGYLPHTIEVDFPGLDSGGTTNKTATTAGLHTQTKLFRSTGISNEDAIWNGGTTTLQDFTNQFAADWYSWQLSKVEATYAGIVNWNPVGLEDMVEWRFTEDEVSTRVSRGPVQDLTEDLLHAVSLGLVVFDSFGGKVYNTGSIWLVGAGTDSVTVGLGSANTPQNVAKVTITGSDTAAGSSWITQTITSNPTITFSGGGSLTFNGPIAFCSASTITFNGSTSFPFGFTATGGITSSGGFYWPETVNPALSSGTTNNYTTSTLNTIQDLPANSGGSTFTGFVANTVTSPADGLFQWLVNTGGNDLTLNHADSGSSSGNQFFTPNGNPFIIPIGYSVPMKYDTSISKWRLLVDPTPRTYTAGTGSPYSLTSAFTDVTSITATVPKGEYEIWVSGMYDYTPGSGGQSLQARLYDGTNPIGNTDGTVIAQNDFTPLGGTYEGTFSLMSPYTATGPTTITLQAKYVGSNGSIDSANLFILKTA